MPKQQSHQPSHSHQPQANAKSTSSTSFLQRCIGQRLAEGFASRSLQSLLIIPFVIQIVAAVGITGWVAFKKGRHSIQILAQHYSAEIGQRIQSELQAKFELVHEINATNADAVELGLLNFDDPDGLELHFWNQIRRHKFISYIYVGNDQGGMRGAGRTRGATDKGHEYRSYETFDNEGNDFRAGAYHIYRTDDQGVRDPIIDDVYVGYDARKRPWYKGVVQQKSPVWTDIYLYFGEQFLGIAASHPVYDSQGLLQGVFVTDLELDQLNKFLGKLTIGGSGEAFIVERKGTIVASSTDEKPFRLTDTESRTQERLLAQDSAQPLIAESTKTLIECFGTLENVSYSDGDTELSTATTHYDCENLSDRSPKDFFVDIDDQRYFGHVQPFKHAQGLDWLIVVVLPESDFTQELHATIGQAIAICITALTLTILFGIWFLRWVTRPLRRLSEASQAIADGDFSQRIYLNRGDEIGVLSRSFDRMADQVQDSVNSLQAQVAERTVHLEAARKEAEEANQAKSQFLANMSHELRTPLNGILGYAQVLQRDRQLDPKHQRGLQVIQDCGVHLLNLINEVLDLSKIEAQRMELHPHAFALRPFLDAIAALFRLRADQKGITFHYEPHPDLPTAVEADDQKLRQVLINLLGNAIKFTDHGSVTLRITPVPQRPNAPTPQRPDALPPRSDRAIDPSMGYAVALDSSMPNGLYPSYEKTPPASPAPSASGSPAPHSIQFQIEDTGPGIAPNYQQIIFQPFRQVGEQRVQEGTGLGLSISYQLVELMGGQLTLKSQLGEGSCFSFDLPLPAVPEFQAQDTDQPGTYPFASHCIIGFEGPPRRALVIDDIPENRTFVLDLLSSIGFEVFEADNGQSGLDMLTRVRPHVVLLDLIMPIMDGFTTAKTIRHNPQWQDFQDVAIIAMSASTLSQGKPQSLAAGCDAFLLKPINTDELLGLLETVLNLEWQYSPEFEDASIASTLAQPRQANVALNPTQDISPAKQALIPPSQPILETLWQSAQIGDISGILDILDQINDPELVPFATELRQLAADFRVKAIQEFLAAFSINESR